MNNQWKQPTPTDIRENENVDLLSRMIFFDILNGCQNQTYHKVYYHGNKRIDLELERGQYLFVISRYQRELKVPRKRIEKSLEIISKWYTELLIENKPFGLIITVKDYDSLTKMTNEKGNEMKTKLKRNENEVKSNNKSNKSDKSENISKDIDKPVSYGNKDINTCMDYLKERVGGQLDGTEKSNRQYCYNLIRKIKKGYPKLDPVEQVQIIIDVAIADAFHSKNATSFKYLYYNFVRIIKQAQGNTNKVAEIK